MGSYRLYQRELLQKEYHPTVSAYYFKTWETFQMDYHTHDDLEIMYVIEGKCTVLIRDKLISMKKGDFVLLDANLEHQLVVEQHAPCRMLNIELSFVEKQGMFPSIKELASKSKRLSELSTFSQSYLVLKDSNEIFHTLKNLVLELDKKEEERDMMVQLHLSQLLIQICRIIIDEKEKQIEHQQTNVYLKKVIEFIHHHYDCDLKMKEIGEAVNLHPGYLHRIFKKHFNMTVMEYLTNLRIEKAKMLLADTDIPIIEISSFVGINSRQYFSLLFKKHTQYSPHQYRKLVEQNILKHSE
ncbi:AraC family transcriptional regulator [Bacillus suaedae]|uniref:Helix-turn-helix transcriptional regulator n=1 Tax=Halalkalibacter suaedae TaxID=2822140 RepID=A0A940WQQ1_9BACI|nr:AraC family transcriptional regulator [Bacillus suaedae]MBP3950944.1 helix-turn-helix transcriptional regulator [Bacillus suaedae]